MDAVARFLAVEIFGNPLRLYIITIAFFILSVYAIRLLQKWFLKKAHQKIDNEKYPTSIFLCNIIERIIIPVLYPVVFYLFAMNLNLPERLARGIDILLISVITIQGTRFVLSVLIYLLQVLWIKRGVLDAVVSQSLVLIIKILIWGLAIVFLLDNLGFNISAMIAGLGIGGVAVALASQTVLADLFHYFVIFFDKPFETGDFIVLGEFMGVIEHVGIKTTRFRSLDGEQIIFSNTDLASSRIRNFKRMAERRVLFKLGVSYETDLERLKRIPVMMREIIEAIPQTRFDRAHFQSYGDVSLVFEVVYYVLNPDYNKFMDIQQKIYFCIYEIFDRNGIDFTPPMESMIGKLAAKAGHNKSKEKQ